MLLSRTRALLTALFHRGRVEAEMDEELRFHLEAYAEDLERAGVARAEARRRARVEFGGVAVAKEDCRSSLGLRLLEEFRQDLRAAVRNMQRKPGFTATAVASLALGIGANCALFSLVDAVLLRTPKVAKPGELVRITEGDQDGFTYASFESLRAGARLLAGVAATEKTPRLTILDEPGEESSGVLQLVSSSYFDVLGVLPARGRCFHNQDRWQGAEATAVISDAYWRRRWGARASAVGTRFRYGKRELMVAGVAPPGFRGMSVDFAVDIWVPVEQIVAPGSAELTHGRWVQVLGRLKPGVKPGEAAAEAGALMSRRVGTERGANGFSSLRGRFARPLIALECVAGLVLLIACVNLTNLLMAGAAERRREIATRQALGAGRCRLVRQLLVENLALSATGAAAAVLVASWFSGRLLNFLPPDAAPALTNLRFQTNGHVLAFTAFLALFTCLLFGLAPAFRATAFPAAGLREQSGRDAGGKWTIRILGVAEIAICTLLLIVAGLFLRSLRNLKTVDAGFRTEGLLVADLFHRSPGESPDGRLSDYDAVRKRALHLPGVKAAGYSQIGQLSGHAIEYRIYPEGAAIEQDRAGSAMDQRASPGFLAAMGTPILRGRDFTERDTKRSPQVAIVNESFARRFFPGADPLGRRFHTEVAMGAPVEIVGIAKDARWINLREPPAPMCYRPIRQEPGGLGAVTLAIRARDGAAITPAVRGIARGFEPGLRMREPAPFTEVEDRALATERAIAYISAGFGALAMAVTTIGVYGVLAYSVSRRRREIGIRMALGATRTGIAWMTLRESLAVLAAGLVIGVPLALAGMRSAASMLFGIAPGDPSTVSVALGAVTATTLAACQIPARRAARTQPAVTLRHE